MYSTDETVMEVVIKKRNRSQKWQNWIDM